MRPSEKYALVGLCCAAAFASGAAVRALGHHGILEISSAREHQPAQAPGDIAVPMFTPEPPQVASRFAYVPFDAVPLLSPPTADQLPPTDMPDEINPDSWAAETRAEPTTPSDGRRLMASPPLRRQPWRTLTLGTPARAYTLIDRLAEISPAAYKRLAEKFETAKAAWPPAEIGLVAIKDEKILELFARSNGGAWKLIHRYPVLAASGVAGPKLRQGDRQVPEGVYGIAFLNPNSRYDVSLRVNYPNAFDRQMAAKDGRKDLGGDIMIHGKAGSAGCLAVSDETSEELFVLASNVGLPNIKLIIAPTDFRRNGLPAVDPSQPPWVPKLYTEVASAMSELKAPPTAGLFAFFAN
jgi:hypothetical protein